MQAQAINNSTADREILSERLLDAPLALVWRAWTDPEHLKQWYGPNGFSNTFHEFDLKPGGHWRFIMHGPDGTDHDNHSVFVEIVPQQRLVYDHLDGCVYRATISFEAVGEKTRVTFHMVFASAERFNEVKGFVIAGNQQNFDRLAAHLSTMI